jgi:HD-GYP domain-containing protein (c-di-GMP phosphodiesterase class II)
MNQHTLNVINNKLPPTYININEIMQLIKEIVASIQGNPTLIDLTNRESKETYLIPHQVNVTLISLVIGHGLGYSRMRLEELGLAAFFHDIGMQELLFLVDKKGKLSVDEYELVRNHIKIGIQILQQIPELPTFVIDVCYQHHERLSGSGYLGIQEGTIHEYAQIIGLADTFESLSHNRSHRTAKTVQMTLRELTEMTDTEFSKKALKILIKKVGIYPVGTFVLLNTQDVAEVIKNNEKFPLRPIVKIVYTSGDKPLNSDCEVHTSSKTLDLLTNQCFYITATLTKEEALSKAVTDKL